MDLKELVSKLPKNKTEAEFQLIALSAGWIPLRKGWPDYLCYRDGKLTLVEVKPKDYQLEDSQKLIILLLARAGVPCFRWTPKNGFVRIYPNNWSFQTLLNSLISKEEKSAIIESAKQKRKGKPFVDWPVSVWTSKEADIPPTKHRKKREKEKKNQ